MKSTMKKVVLLFQSLMSKKTSSITTYDKVAKGNCK